MGSFNHGVNQELQRASTYKDLTNRKRWPFNRSIGVIAQTRRFEKMESVFEICGCPKECKVRFIVCTFDDRALSWWNGHVKALTLPVANSMTYEDLKTIMLEENYLMGEVHRL